MELPTHESFMEGYAASMRFLQLAVADRAWLVKLTDPERVALLKLCGAVVAPSGEDKKKLNSAFRKEEREKKKAADHQLLATTGLRVSQKMGGVTVPFYAKPPTEGPALIEASHEEDESNAKSEGGGQKTLFRKKACYCCGARYATVHHFYASMCGECGDLNFRKRLQTADLSGRIALVTGGRVKIGFMIVLKLLRAGCRVVVVTRFARDAVVRYSKEEDFGKWSHLLQIHGVDLRHTPSVEAFCAMLVRTLPKLDFIVHNACQTVRRPSGFYKHMWKRERMAIELLRPEEQQALQVCQGVVDPVLLSQIELLPEEGDQEELFPADVYDTDKQQVDLRPVNSWKLELADVSATEVVEVHLCNAVAPFVINGRLKCLMVNGPGDRHIVNVSAMEGQFYRTFKTAAHPMTNMAKASLNMMTRTSASDYVRSGIHMNSVDTGWVTEENPAPIAERLAEHFTPPLDIIDGAARCLDPIFDGLLTGNHMWGKFVKNYKECPW